MYFVLEAYTYLLESYFLFTVLTIFVSVKAKHQNLIYSDII